MRRPRRSPGGDRFPAVVNIGEGRVSVLRPDGPAARPGAIVCAIVNDMPDAALLQTERQWLEMLASSTDGTPVAVRFYSLPGVGRGSRVARYIRDGYFPFRHLLASRPDLVVVTGSEPTTADISHEPLWPATTELLDHLAGRVPAMVLSCMAAHGALRYFDGLDRRPMGAKCCGVFPHTVVYEDRLTHGLPPVVALPHSRFNEVPAEQMLASGWHIAAQSEVGWGVAWSTRGRSRIVLFQGHPEYDADTLLREYRRDVLRYAAGDSSDYPEPPANYLTPPSFRLLHEVRDLVEGGSPMPAERFPFAEIAAGLGTPWRQPLSRLLANLMDPAATRAAELAR